MTRTIGVLAWGISAACLSAPAADAAAFNLAALQPSLHCNNAKASVEVYRGRTSVKMSTTDAGANAQGVCIVPGAALRDGTIELDVAGDVLADAPPDARGFTGLAFRMAGDGAHFEAFYLRPTNGRADDQLRRNHSVQYIAMPDYEWPRLRKEDPGKYEVYADVAPGCWTHLRIEVKGAAAKLYVDHARQPTLIVNDLKNAASPGEGIALWIGPGTVAHFAGLSVNPPR